jgi:Asp-tRNA(Asn)/Glu-tRNA(Gln) amidotransferase A subunit family amidase
MLRTDLAWLNATEVVRAVRAGEIDRQDVVRAHLARIGQLNDRIGAFIHVDEGARAGGGALSGVSLGVKDTQPVARMPWTYGSPRFRFRIAERDAVPVARARAAGAAVLGKLNLPELAAAVGTTNELFPPTQNPWREGWTPGGSSGGSGAAVAAGLCTTAFGDDMGGSIRIPASCCGVVGLRPSPGRVPTELPDPTRLSVRGPLARSVADVRLLFEVMSGEPAPEVSARRLRIGVVEESPIGMAPAVEAAVRRAAGALEVAGHRIDRVTWDPMPAAHAYLVVRPASVSTMPGEPDEYGPAVRGLIQRGRELSARQYLEALTAGLDAGRRVAELLETDYDALLTPTLGLLPMPIAEVPTFLAEGWDVYTQFVLPVSFAGLPAVSLPAGQADGLPVGVQLAGRYRHEWRLLALAEELEALEGFGFQHPPDFD